MILQALAAYYQRLSKDGSNQVAPRGFQHKEIPFLLILEPDGTFSTLIDTRTKVGKKLLARQFLVPQEKGRSGSRAWQTANLLWDHYGYVLGWPKSDTAEHRDMAAKQHVAFKAELAVLVTKYPEDHELTAVMNFLNSDHKTLVFQHPLWADCAKIPGCNLSFIVTGQEELVCQNGSVRDYLTAIGTTNPEEDDEEAGEVSSAPAFCLVSGDLAPVARLHPRTPIAGAKSNAKIVAFQKNMGFDSYGKEQCHNAPTSAQAAFAYTTALNTLLGKTSRQKLGVGDATTVFWAEEKHHFEDLFAQLFDEPGKENPEQLNQAIRTLYRSPESGTPPLENDLTRFYVLGLAPNAARIAIRFWHAGTVGRTAASIRQHFEDCALAHRAHEPEHLSLWRLLVSTAALRKSENIPPNLAGEMMHAILAGTNYPQSLLAATLRRCRAEREITYPRATLLKAVLVRSHRLSNATTTEVGMSLDESNPNVGYRLGRLFAVLEKIQEEASPGINATIRDRFYGAASSTPVTAFPHLLKLKNHHLSKLENRGRAVNLERLLGAIFDPVVDFPSHLAMQDQGRFAIGYYHQRQALFTKQDKNT
ncbi:MAG: type I-C CRISPR-associated protein Cas8c/Csd1 [Deltaproteobacteria bacterium RIFOXYA12_FULL_61_11]|nr:MAG: type I-C CRISPR-associated protein Cas8c/Csd1 [Deltaproteobacteria bacterium RIFOXYA12_FULL_61_11]